MNLIQGKLLDSKQVESIMPRLSGYLGRTLSKPVLSPEIIISACETLLLTLSDESILPILRGLGMEEAQAKEELKRLRLMFSRPYLEERLKTELGENYGELRTRRPLDLTCEVEEQIYPLGVLFHIAAGNRDGLPAYSVIEGLLAGNINLLKLPAVDGGLTVTILQMLCSIEPVLAEYIYVFELSSTELSSIRRLAKLADAIVVWGGDEAVNSIRAMASPNTRVIEWGHKLSFAYVTKAGMQEEKLRGLARHICLTNQLLCSSCQGIYLDVEKREEAERFCRDFLMILESEAAEFREIPLAARAQNTLRLYTRRLEKSFGCETKIFQGERSSLLLEPDSELTASMQYRSLWVKRLERDRLVTRIHPYKNHLQTAALLCGTDEWEMLREKLWRAGVVQVSQGADMSDSYCGAAHDGDYPLRRYTRVVSAKKE